MVEEQSVRNQTIEEISEVEEEKEEPIPRILTQESYHPTRSIQES